MAEARHLLHTLFGHPSFAAGQEEVIRILRTGDHGGSALAVLPTGGAKSLCYQLPALLLRDGVTLLVVATVALMDDQLRRLEEAAIPAEQVSGSIGSRQWKAIKEGVACGELRVLVTTPEGLRGRVRDRLLSIPVELLVVDEAHCILAWGPTFRPDYLRLQQVAQQLSIRRVLALTAMASHADAAARHRAAARC